MFYGILVQHFANVAGLTPLHMGTIDVLTVHILELTAEVPYYAATVARARLTRAHKRMSAALAGSQGHGGWPGQYFFLLPKHLLSLMHILHTCTTFTHAHLPYTRMLDHICTSSFGEYTGTSRFAVSVQSGDAWLSCMCNSLFATITACAALYGTYIVSY